ncbi:jmjd4 [Symbiodinium natans]|uniref:Jmjd4 protein n=1 Tax=Symbiodinium natans TaxID=878477 RepID=A0A812P155_9DINO|nr:jmjd4 [Symbiodinium natans]
MARGADPASVQRVSGSDLSTKLFIEQYAAVGRPVILLDLVSSWPAYSQWRCADGGPNLQKLAEDFQGVTGPVVDCGHDYDIQSWDVGDYFRWAAGTVPPEGALYLKDWHLVDACRSLGLEVPYEAPDYLSAPVHDWLNLHMDRATGKDDYRFSYVGVAGTRTPLHHDVLFSHSWSANICGRKHWIFYPPDVSQKLLDSFGNAAESAQPQRRCEGWWQRFPGLQEAWDRRLEAFQEEGELMFVPSGWYHEVENLTMTISINHNWLNASNAVQVWTFLRSEWQSVREKIGDLQDTFDSPDEFLEQCQVLMRANCGMDVPGTCRRGVVGAGVGGGQAKSRVRKQPGRHCCRRDKAIARSGGKLD